MEESADREQQYGPSSPSLIHGQGGSLETIDGESSRRTSRYGAGAIAGRGTQPFTATGSVTTSGSFPPPVTGITNTLLEAGAVSGPLERGANSAAAIAATNRRASIALLASGHAIASGIGGTQRPPAQPQARATHVRRISLELLEPTEDEMYAEIRGILATADLMAITKRQIREQLSDTLCIDLEARKAQIDKMIRRVLTTME